MRWMRPRAVRERQRLEDAHRELERESEREKKVDEVVARMEAARLVVLWEFQHEEAER